MLSALELGADNTGMRDNATVMENLGGLPVHFPPGIYRFESGNIDLPPETHWSGDGVTFRADFQEPAEFIRMGSRTYLRGVTVDGNSSAHFGIKVHGSDVTLDSVRVKDTVHHGIYVTESERVRLAGLRIVSCGRPEYPTSAGVFISATRDLQLSDCHAIDCHAQGFYLGGYGGSRLTMTGCVAVSNGAAGIDVRIPGSTVTACIAQRNGGPGLAVSLAASGPARTARTSIIGGDFSHNSGPGNYEVSLSHCDTVTLIGATIEPGAEAPPKPVGVYAAACSRVILANNAIGPYVTAGLALGSLADVGCDDVMVSGNILTGPATAAGIGVLVGNRASGVTVIGNRITRRANGVRLFGADITDVHIGDNHYFGNTFATKDDRAT